MAKIAIVTDTHFGARSDSLVFHDYFSRFFDNLFFPTLDQEGIKDVIHAGDVVDRRKFINFNILNGIKKNFIQPLIDRDMHVHITVGNHDTFYKNTNSINAVDQLFSDVKHVSCYTSATDVVLGGMPILFIPWINMANHDKTLLKIKKTKAKIAIGHLEIAGFNMYRGVKNENGMDKNIFKKFDKVLTGHYHHKSDDGKIFYLGSPYEMTFSDINDPRGFHILDTETGSLRFIENPHRMFYKIYYDDQGKTLQEIFDETDFTKYSGTYVKVIINKKTNPHFFDRYLEKLYESNPADISVLDEINYGSENPEEMVDQAEDTITILNKYVDGMELDVDKTKIKDQLHSLYIEACNYEPGEKI